MKKRITIIMTCIILIFAITDIPVFASSKSSKAKVAYSTWLKDQSSESHFTLADLNGDKIPELLYTETLIKSNTFSTNRVIYVYTYINGEMVQVGGIGAETYNIYYNKKNNTYVVKYSNGDRLHGYTTLDIDEKNIIVQKNNCTISDEITHTDYSIERKYVSKSKFNKYINENYNIYDGTKFNSSKFDSLKVYKNTSKSRKSVLY